MPQRQSLLKLLLKNMKLPKTEFSPFSYKVFYSLRVKSVILASSIYSSACAFNLDTYKILLTDKDMKKSYSGNSKFQEGHNCIKNTLIFTCPYCIGFPFLY